MEFIKAEEFLEQDEEVQKVLIEWWKNNINQCDLIYNIKFKEIRALIDTDMFNSDLKRNLILESSNIPLWTEGQLRTFIQDKTKDKYDILYSFGLKKYISFYKYTENENKATYEVENHDLLKAYWKVAIKVASKCL